MDIQLRLNNVAFEKVKNGIQNVIKHGYSRNKKYQRLFGEVSKITLLNEDKSRSIIREMQSISIETENNKQIFKIQLA